MRKFLGMVLVVAVFAGLYSMSSWYLGKKAESVVEEQYRSLEKVPYIKVVKHDHKGGIFSSEDTVTLEIFGDMARAMARIQGASAQPTPNPAEGLKLTVHTLINHGPLPGLSTPAVAVATTELVLPEPARAKVAKIFGDKQPLVQRTVFHLDGSGTNTISSPAVKVTLPPDQNGRITSIVWDGFKATVDFSPGLRHYTMTGAAPKLGIKDNRGVHMILTGIGITADQKRIFEDDPFLYCGSEKLTIDEWKISGQNNGSPVELKKMVMDIEIPLHGKFLDMATKIGVESFQTGSETYSPAHFDFTLSHLHARTMANLYRSMMDMYANPALFSGNPAKVKQKVFAPLAGQAQTLLGYNPGFSIDRLSLATPAGEGRLAAHLRLKGVKPEDLKNPSLFLKKVEADGDLAVSENMVIDMIRHSPGNKNGKNGAPAEKAQRLVNEFQGRLAMLSKQGYISREGQLIKSKAEYKNGQLKVNGQLLDLGNRAKAHARH